MVLKVTKAVDGNSSWTQTPKLTCRSAGAIPAKGVPAVAWAGVSKAEVGTRALTWRKEVPATSRMTQLTVRKDEHSARQPVRQLSIAVEAQPKQLELRTEPVSLCRILDRLARSGVRMGSTDSGKLKTDKKELGPGPKRKAIFELVIARAKSSRRSVKRSSIRISKTLES